MNKRKILGFFGAPSTALGISPAGLRRPQARLNFDSRLVAALLRASLRMTAINILLEHKFLVVVKLFLKDHISFQTV
jgi:hypothetical protein